jgi:PAS domain S-box-containing protein
MDTLNFSARQKGVNRIGECAAEGAREIQSPVASPPLTLGNQAYLIELLPMAAYAVRAPDGVIAWFNSRAAELWGRVPVVGDSEERFCGAHRLYYPDGTCMAHCHTPVALALSTGVSVHEQDVVIERPDGSRVTVSVQIDPIRDQNGKIVGVVNFFHDITDRKLAERATRLLAAIVDSSEDAIISKSVDGMIISWNKGAERIFGYSAEEAIGKHITLIIPQDRWEEETNILNRLSRGERIEHYETVRVRKDGEQVHISLTISPLKDDQGQFIGASKIARDITERRQIEQTLAERALLLDLSSDAIVVRDEADRVTYWNKGAADLYGYSREEVMGRVTHELFRTEFPKSMERINEELHEEKRWTGELHHLCKDGRQITVLSRWTLDQDDRGQRKRILESNNDITRQKLSEKQLVESEDRLRKLADGLETLVSVRTEELQKRNAEILEQSHQLRELSTRLLQTQDEERRRIARDLHDSAGQIVTVLGMNLTALRNRAAQNAEFGDALEECHELVHQLSRDIRTLSYLLHPPLLEENGLSGAIEWYIKGLEERSHLKIELYIPKSFGRLPGEIELAVFRLIQECVTNILRHSGSKTATIRLTRTAENIGLEIEDNGKGIPSEKLAEIRAQRSGVGITGMRERVRHLGGTLDIESIHGGTKVSVIIPVAADHKPEPQNLFQQDGVVRARSTAG